MNCEAATVPDIERAVRHTAICEAIGGRIHASLPSGIVFEIADLVLDGLFPRSELDRIFRQMDRRGRRIDNRAAYFRRCVSVACSRLGIKPPSGA